MGSELVNALESLVASHSQALTMLACGVGVVGALITARIWSGALARHGMSRVYGCLLAASAGGAATWAMHFIAMLGHTPGAAATFDPELTIVSVIVAIAGFALGVFLSTIPIRAVAVLLGGTVVGMSIAAMHYIGMLAYQLDAPTSWDSGAVIASVVLALFFSLLTVGVLTRQRATNRVLLAGLALGASVVALHYCGMAAFNVHATPGEHVGHGANQEAFNSLAIGVTLCAALVLGVGFISEALFERMESSSKRMLRHEALHDPLTGKPNRRHFHERLVDQCQTLNAFGAGFALLLIDIDHFKRINDTLGHPVGDELLRRCASRFEKVTDGAGMLARLGGDEFAILLMNGSTLEEAERLADRIVEFLSRPMIIDGNIVDVSVSIGVVASPQHAPTADHLIQHADIALYASKEAGRSRYTVFREAMMQRAKARRALEQDIKRAVTRDELRVFYQPFFDPSTETATGAEALVRWDHPEHGLIRPDQFVPIAEDTGAIRRIGEWVLHTACHAAMAWPDGSIVAVNVSPKQVTAQDFPDTLKRILVSTGLPPERLELEITERVILGDGTHIQNVLRELSDMGVSIALDDFGTGYASLTYLAKHPISRIKIDRSFFRELTTKPAGEAIVRAISDMGQALDICVTAEGIETKAHRDFAVKVGCSTLQGFFYSEPVTEPLIPQLFEKTRSAGDRRPLDHSLQNHVA